MANKSRTVLLQDFNNAKEKESVLGKKVMFFENKLGFQLAASLAERKFGVPCICVHQKEVEDGYDYTFNCWLTPKQSVANKIEQKSILNAELIDRKLEQVRKRMNSK